MIYIYMIFGLIIFLVLLKIFKECRKNEIVKKNVNLKLFGYKLIYSDNKTDSEDLMNLSVLKSEEYNIKGKPDYIFKHKNKERYIPVELKSGSIGENMLPRENDLYQLIAYFVIIDEYFGTRSKKGFLVYKDYMFEVKNTKKLRNNLSVILEEMREMLKTGEGEVEPSFIKCRNCVCRNVVCEFESR